jgi:hypothetical protein
VHSNLKRRLAIAVVAVAAAAFAGGAYAATKDSNASVRQAFLNDVAKRLHVTPQQLTSALEGAEVDQINAAVAAGKLTQAQGNALKQRVQTGHVLLGALGLFRAGAGAPGPPFPGGPGFFRGNLRPRMFPGPAGKPALPGAKPAVPVPGPGGKQAFPGPRLAFPVVGPLAGAAGYLGLSESQLLRQLGRGKSLAQIAKAHGKSVSGLVAAMVANFKTRLDKAVSAKMLTSAQAQRVLKSYSNAIGDEINRAPHAFGFVHPGGGKPWQPALRARPPKGPASLIAPMTPAAPATAVPAPPPGPTA